MFLLYEEFYYKCNFLENLLFWNENMFLEILFNDNGNFVIKYYEFSLFI